MNAQRLGDKHYTYLRIIRLDRLMLAAGWLVLASLGLHLIPHASLWIKLLVFPCYFIMTCCAIMLGITLRIHTVEWLVLLILISPCLFGGLAGMVMVHLGVLRVLRHSPLSLALFVGLPDSAIEKSLPDHCHECGYNLTGSTSGRCSECGAENC